MMEVLVPLVFIGLVVLAVLFISTAFRMGYDLSQGMLDFFTRPRRW